ncbi:hypothetical protein ACFOON_17395 [Novosphingobium piscinae]|uniref:Antibiotic ABC transporter n=1 Tax=Novosphingobium piscinae TaxID=1507448 RepID=A0A7X1G093_9SPHN|nr:hypothetical protein [Novosphingobium piscinae]MBC2670293.1 hypothetical protein [Novosphingobium piscinae]
MTASPLAAGCDLARQATELIAESWCLTLESAAVIWLRLGKLAALDAAAMAEGERMVEEKMQAALEHSARLMTGGFGLAPQSVARGSLAYYRGRVADNRRRLTRPARTGR